MLVALAMAAAIPFSLGWVGWDVLVWLTEHLSGGNLGRFWAGLRFKRGRGRNCGYCHCHRIGDFVRSPTSEPCGSSLSQT